MTMNRPMAPGRPVVAHVRARPPAAIPGIRTHLESLQQADPDLAEVTADAFGALKSAQTVVFAVFPEAEPGGGIHRALVMEVYQNISRDLQIRRNHPDTDGDTDGDTDDGTDGDTDDGTDDGPDDGTDGTDGDTDDGPDGDTDDGPDGDPDGGYQPAQDGDV